MSALPTATDDPVGSTLEKLRIRSETDQAMKLVGERYFAGRILRSVRRWSGGADTMAGDARAAAVLSMLLIGVAWAINRFASIPFSGVEAVSLLATGGMLGGSLFIVKRLHDALLPPNTGRILDVLDSVISLTHVRDWLRSSFGVWPQLLFALTTAFAALWSLSQIPRIPNTIPTTPGLWLTVFAGMFGVGQGLYCALKIPTIARTAARAGISLYPYDPSSSVGVRVGASAFSRLALVNGAVAAYVIGLLLLAAPTRDMATSGVALAWIIASSLSATFSFVYPTFHLSRAIRETRRKTLQELEAMIAEARQTPYAHSPTALEALNTLVGLRERVQHSNATAINVRSLLNYAGSLIIPFMIPFVTFVLDAIQKNP